MADNKDEKLLQWRVHALELVTDITLDPEMHELLYGTSVFLIPPAATNETVLLEVPRDQLKAIQQAFPDVKILEAKPGTPSGQIAPERAPATRLPRDKWDKIPPFEPVKSDKGKIEPFDLVAGVIGGVKKKGGGFDVS
jgi:hypothetical protein